MTSYSRRKFIKTSGVVLGGVALGARTLSAREIGNSSAADFLGDLNPGESLRALASHALNSAKAAGASYADIRISHWNELGVGLGGGIPGAGVVTRLSYGIRTVVNGAVAFNYGTVPTADAIAAVARNAVIQAKGFARLGIEKIELAPAPVVTGEWTTPFEIDPFKVPIMEQGNMIANLSTAASRVEMGAIIGTLLWQRETKVCANTEGSLVTQTFQTSRVALPPGVEWYDLVVMSSPDLSPRHAGYEVLTNPALPGRLKALTERVKEIAMLPPKPMDVGRYPIAMDGSCVACMLAKNLGPTVEMDRVLGIEAGASGTSFLSPHEEVLGQQVFSPKLSVTLSRPAEYVSGAKWDDECVEPQEVNVIVDGKVMDYATDRMTAPALSAWYTKQNKSMKSNGYATVASPNRPLVVSAGCVSMKPEQSRMSIDDMSKDMKRGILLVGLGNVNIDQQGASGMIDPVNGLALEIRNGKAVSVIKGSALQFKTSSFWKGLTVIGDASTQGTSTVESVKGQPWQTNFVDGVAPAALFSSIDVISMSGQ